MTGPAYETVIVTQAGPVRFVEMNRPAVRNCLDLVLRRELGHALREADTDPGCRTVVLTGTGPVFCAGGDIKTLAADPAGLRERLDLVGEITRALLESQTPVVAAVTGGAWGAGLALAAACDVVVVGRSARMVASFGRFGLVGDTGAFHVLQQRVGHARAKEILLLNAALTADDAVAEGLATVAVDDSDVRRVAHDLALRLASAGPGANARTLRIFGQSEQDFESVLASEIEAQIDLIDQPSFVEGQRAFVEKREPHWWDDLGAPVPNGLLDVTIGGRK